jgi:hypothetical protein
LQSSRLKLIRQISPYLKKQSQSPAFGGKFEARSQKSETEKFEKNANLGWWITFRQSVKKTCRMANAKVLLLQVNMRIVGGWEGIWYRASEEY